MQSDEVTLESIESAIEKIEDGVFGECEECSGAISKARLNAIPYTPLCIKCAQKLESR
jgi:DnaK suppressor protein